MTDIGSAVGGLVISVFLGSSMIAASLVYVGLQLAEIGKNICNNK